MKNFYTLTLPILLIALLALPSIKASGQLAVGASSADPTSPFSAFNLVQNWLLGEGVELVSVTYTGNPQALGYFSGAEASIGFADGLIMSSGQVTQQANPASFFASTSFGINTNDPDLAAIATGAIRDLSRLEFTFIPYGDTLLFDWVLGSEEYPSWVGSAYNDVFGFFLSGPGISGPFSNSGVNLATLPNGNPASINTIFTVPSYFINNIGGPAPAFNGYSVPFQAFSLVQACQPYTIKLAVSDVTDHIFDTGVFLRRGSFEVTGILTNIETPYFDNAIAAGCDPAIITFCLENPPTEEYLLSIGVGGTAIPGLHYSPLPAVIWINAGELCTGITIETFPEEIDSVLIIELYVDINPCVTDTFEIRLLPNMLVPPPPLPDTTICPGEPVSLNATVPIDLPPPQTFYKWDSVPIPSPNSGMSSTPPVVSTLVVEDFEFSTVVPNLITSVCVRVMGFVRDLNLILVAPNGQFMPLSILNGGAANGQHFGCHSTLNPTYQNCNGENLNTCFTPFAANSITQSNITATIPPTNTYSPYVAIGGGGDGNWKPIGQWSALWGAPINGTWQLYVDDVIPLGPSMNPPLSFATLIDWSINFAPTYDVWYSWAPSNYNITCVDCPVTTVTPFTETDYIVTISDAYGCVFTDTATISMPDSLPAPLVSCTDITGHTITFNWSNVPGASSYLVSLDQQIWFPPNNGPNSHIVTGLGLSQDVTFYVQAISLECGLAGHTGMETCTTLPCPEVPVQAMVNNDPLCIGSTDGSVTISLVNPDPMATYAWFKDGELVSTSQTFTDASVGTYVGVVYDSLNCPGYDTLHLTAPQLLLLETLAEDALCYDQASGIASITSLTGGTGPGTYTYEWIDASGTEVSITDSASGLTIGDYFLTVYDGNGCAVSDTLSIGQPDSIEISFVAEDADCFGAATGSIVATVTGGVGSYEYAWSDGQIAATASDLTAGNYTLVVTDANGCIMEDSELIEEPEEIILTLTADSVDCAGNETGSMAVAITGGVAPFTYQWDDALLSTTDAVQNVAAGTYEVIVTDAQGCTSVESIEVGEPEELVLELLNAEDVICFGDAVGPVELAATGGTGTLTYEWSNGLIGNSIDSVYAGTYTVSVTDANGCVDTEEFTISEPLELTITVLSNEALCFGSPTGAAYATVTGGVGDYFFTWLDASGQSLGITSDTATGLTSGTYQVVAFDANGCDVTDTVFVPTAEELEIVMVDSTPTSCYQGNDGTATIAITGGTEPYNYIWNDPLAQTSATATGLAPGSYIVIVTDANDCEVSYEIQVEEPVEMTATLTSDPALCYMEASGTVEVTAQGGVVTTGYTYLWSNGGTADQVEDVLSGWHFVTVTDNNGCEYVDSVFVGQPDTAVYLAVDGSDVLCFEGTSGEATVTPAGGTGPYTFDWVNAGNQTTATATGLAAGTYTVLVTDQNGCTEEISVSIDEPEILEVAMSSIPLGCSGETTGQAIAAVSGGTGEYTFQWDDPMNQTSSTASDLAAGNYTVVVTDENGCVATNSVEVIEPDPLEISIIPSDVLCFGETTGTAAVTASGGMGIYTYAWSDGQSGAQVNLPAGTYTVTVTDENDCFITETVVIEQPDALQLSATSMTPVDCHGASTGTAQVSASGGAGSYSFVWNDPQNQTGNSVGNLAAGIYTVVVTDDNGCTHSIAVTVTEPPIPLSVDTEPFVTSCYGSADGSIDAVPTGGTMPYTYTWSHNASLVTPTVQGLVAGTYQVTVTDANGCTTVSQTTVQEPDALMLNAVNTEAAACFESSDGIATVSVTGGTPGSSPNPAYTYSWNTFPIQTGAQATGLKGGNTYVVVVTDAQGCTAATNVTIEQPEPLMIQTDAIPALCFNEASGVARVASVIGGTPNYSYQWSQNANNATTDSVPNLSAGVYTVTITDANGCSKVASARVEQPQNISANFVVNNVDCHGTESGSLYAQVSGGTPGYSFLWSDGQQDQGAYGLAAGEYFVTVSDQHGCERSFSKTVTEPEQGLDASLIVTDAVCYEGDEGEIQIIASGGTPGYTYSLDGENFYGSARFMGLTAGVYTVFIRDQEGCIETAVAEVDEGLPIWIDHDAPFVIQQGDQIPLVVAVNLPSSTPLSYTWSNQGPQTLDCYDCPRPVASPENTTWYYLTVVDENGCYAETKLQVIVEKNRIIYVATGFTPNQDGVNDYLFVQGPEDAIVEVFQVYDRWGNQMFSTGNIPPNNQLLGWNGVYNGKEVNSGVYTWRAVVRFADGVRVEEAGYTNLIR